MVSPRKPEPSPAAPVAERTVSPRKPEPSPAAPTAERSRFPAKAGTQPRRPGRWAPAFAGEQGRTPARPPIGAVSRRRPGPSPAAPVAGPRPSPGNRGGLPPTAERSRFAAKAGTQPRRPGRWAPAFAGEQGRTSARLSNGAGEQGRSPARTALARIVGQAAAGRSIIADPQGCPVQIDASVRYAGLDPASTFFIRRSQRKGNP